MVTVAPSRAINRATARPCLYELAGPACTTDDARVAACDESGLAPQLADANVLLEVGPALVVPLLQASAERRYRVALASS